MIQEYVFWFVLLIVGFIILWVLMGGKSYEFTGLNSLNQVSHIPNKSHIIPTINRTCPINKDTFGIQTKERTESKYSKINDKNDQIPQENKSPLISTKPPKQKIKIVPSSGSKTTTINSSKGEQICRQVLEQYYGKPFPRVRPDFLINPLTNRKLELDCYNAELKIACEYNGIQHNIYPNWTGQTRQQFIDQLSRDKFKADVCKRLGIYLIIVPHSVNLGSIKDYIIRYLPENYHKRLDAGQTEFPTSSDG